MTECIHKQNIFSKYCVALGVAAFLNCSSLLASNNQDDYDFTTVIKAPELTSTNVVKPIFNAFTNLAFYSGLDNETHKSGFFRYNHEQSSWDEFKLPVTANDDKSINHGIIDAITGPYNNTIALSYKKTNEGITQYLSNTVNGNLWSTLRITSSDNYYDSIISNNVYHVENFIVYGTKHTSALISLDGSAWGRFGLPNTCTEIENCTFVNKHLSSVYNGYILLQADTITQPSEEGTEESDNNQSLQQVNINNKLLFSQNLTSWYTLDAPFSKDLVNKVFKTHLGGLIASVYNHEDGKHVLWFTKDYKKWQSFNLADDVDVLDAKTGYKNYITLSLSHHENSEIIILDPENDTQTVFATFAGKVSSMDWFNNSLYLSGNFVNFRDDSKALMVKMTKKLVDTSSDNSHQENAELVSIDTASLIALK